MDDGRFPQLCFQSVSVQLSLHGPFSLTPQPFPKAEGRGSRIRRRKAIYAIGLFLELGLKGTLPKFCRVLPGIAGLAKDQIDYLLKVSVIVL